MDFSLAELSRYSHNDFESLTQPKAAAHRCKFYSRSMHPSKELTAESPLQGILSKQGGHSRSLCPMNSPGLCKDRDPACSTLQDEPSLSPHSSTEARSCSQDKSPHCWFQAQTHPFPRQRFCSKGFTSNEPLGPGMARTDRAWAQKFPFSPAGINDSDQPVAAAPLPQPDFVPQDAPGV